MSEQTPQQDGQLNLAQIDSAQSDTDNQAEIQGEIAQRKAKLKALRERGNAFPNDFRRDS